MPNSSNWRITASQAFRTFFWLYTDRYKYLANGNRLDLATSLNYGAVFGLVKELHKLYAWFPPYVSRNSMCRFIHKIRYPNTGEPSILSRANYSDKWRAIDKVNALKKFVNELRGEPKLWPSSRTKGKQTRIADNGEQLKTTPRRRPSVAFRSALSRSSRARPTLCRAISFSRSPPVSQPSAVSSPKRCIVFPTGVSASSLHWKPFVKLERFNFEVIWL